MRALFAAPLITAALLATACSSSHAPNLDSAPTTETQARAAIQSELAAVARGMPSPAYLSRFDPDGSISTADTIGCEGDQQRVVLMVVYWVKGIAAGEEAKYRDLIEGGWATRHDWAVVSQRPIGFKTPGGYSFTTTETLSGLSLSGQSPCFDSAEVDGLPMPDTLGEIAR